MDLTFLPNLLVSINHSTFTAIRALIRMSHQHLEVAAIRATIERSSNLICQHLDRRQTWHRSPQSHSTTVIMSIGRTHWPLVCPREAQPLAGCLQGAPIQRSTSVTRKTTVSSQVLIRTKFCLRVQQRDKVCRPPTG